MAGETEALVEVRGGRLYVPAQTYQSTLAGCTAVALLVRDGDWWLVPLAAGAGGLQLKQRTAGGDRVVEAQEFLRSQGIEDTAPAIWLKLAHAAALGAFRLVRCPTT